jgi:hypothetical protein
MSERTSTAPAPAAPPAPGAAAWEASAALMVAARSEGGCAEREEGGREGESARA